jgi:hypothetical protein
LGPRKLIRSAGISKTAPAVPSKLMSSICLAAGFFFSLVMIGLWWVWIVAVLSASLKLIRVRARPRSGSCLSFRRSECGIGSGD